MILQSDSCWLKEVPHGCAGYENINSECKNQTVFCPKLFKLEKLYSMSMLPKSQWTPVVLFSADGHPDRAAFEVLRDISININQFVQNGGNLFIGSNNCGNGKTSWAIKLMQTYMNNNWTTLSTDKCAALFVHVPRFFIELKNNISSKSEYIEQINSKVLEADLVIWDEIAVKNLTEFEHEHLLTLINSRLESGKSNVYTSNASSRIQQGATKSPLEEALSNRLYSRIFYTSTPVEFIGGDMRGKGIEEVLR